MKSPSPDPIDHHPLAIAERLFAIEHDLQEQYAHLNKTERKLLYDIHQCLENLGKWIALSHPYVALYTLLDYIRITILHEGIDIVGEQYPSEIECWVEDNQDTINNLVERVID